jgi:hypothetical protein
MKYANSTRQAVLAIASCLISPLSHAAIQATFDIQQLQLSVTDADGSVQTWPGASLFSGDASWHDSLGAVYWNELTGESRTTPSWRGPFDTNRGYERLGGPESDIGLMGYEVASMTGATSIDIIAGISRVVANDTSAVPRSRVDYSASIGLGPQIIFDTRLRQSPSQNFEDTPITGGVWLAPGSSATLTGTSQVVASQTINDTGAPSDQVRGTFYAGALFELYAFVPGTSISQGTGTLVRDDANMWYGSTFDSLNNWQGDGWQYAQTKPILAQFKNTTDQGMWLIVAAEATVGESLGVVPEPSTAALSALGLLGLAWAVKRQRPVKG